MTALPDAPHQRHRQQRCGALHVGVLAVLGLIVGLITGSTLTQGVSTAETAQLSNTTEASPLPSPAESVRFDSIHGSPSCRGNGHIGAAAAVPVIVPHRDGGQLPLALRTARLTAGPVCWYPSADERQAAADRPLPAPHLTTVLRI
ncbi:hypothetical protein [Nocardia sp. NBC_01009]|uniref:hypothetical protein n=1 Tax=Nocardia sp. NBC_01009 TaxID=2975996 RepID=UPI00386A789F|nr:hypothetical protein OHA42_19595 [Nocardia sp. NBC_01009]